MTKWDDEWDDDIDDFGEEESLDADEWNDESEE